MKSKDKPMTYFDRLLVGDRLLDEVLTYVAADPEHRIDSLLSVAKLFASKSDHRDNLVAIERALAANANTRILAERILKDTNPRVLRQLLRNWGVNATLRGIPKQQEMTRQLGSNVPYFILVDPTGACNLSCEGCWAGAYKTYDQLSFERLDRLCSEAKELGIHWFVMSGGEPLMYPQLFDIARKHDDMAFMLYTNGTLIDDAVADSIIEVGNITPAFSLEGWRETTDQRRGEGVFDSIIAAMGRLRKRGGLFGISLTATCHNCDEIVSDEFIDFLLEQGARYGWIFHYVPIGRDPDLQAMLTAPQRAFLAERVPIIRRTKPIVLADFWNDGDFSQGCIAAGRRYFHITPSGAVQPCAFFHFSTHNINDSSLKEVLSSPFFSQFQERQPFASDHLQPCPIIDVPGALRDIVAVTGARPTHEGAEELLDKRVSDFIDRRAIVWAKEVKDIRCRQATKSS